MSVEVGLRKRESDKSKMTEKEWNDKGRSIDSQNESSSFSSSSLNILLSPALSEVDSVVTYTQNVQKKTEWRQRSLSSIWKKNNCAQPINYWTYRLAIKSSIRVELFSTFFSKRIKKVKLKLSARFGSTKDPIFRIGYIASWKLAFD